jgi:photosystem II stability/assembly factor-like uncharacterized protein
MKTKLLLVAVAIVAVVTTHAQWVQIDSGLTNKTLNGFAYDGNNAVIATSGGEVLYSSNAALSFSKTQLTNSVPVFSPYYQNSSNVFLGGRGNFYRSSNSGSSFSVLGSVSSFGDFRDITFTSSTLGFAVSEACRVAKTTDGGLTWTSQGNQCNGNVNELRDIDFPTATVGFAGGQNGQLIKTSDGGQTWQTVSSGASEIERVQFFDANTGIVAGGTKMRKTTDGGATWNDLSTALPNGSITGFAFSGQSLGYLLIANKIYKTTDGGQTWILDFTPPNNLGSLRRIYIAGTYAIAICSQGTIYRTDLDLSSIKDELARAVSVYPNPANRELRISNYELENGQQIQIFDISGKLIRSEKIPSNYIDIAHLNIGIYFGKLIGHDGNNYTFKFVKQ